MKTFSSEFNALYYRALSLDTEIPGEITTYFEVVPKTLLTQEIRHENVYTEHPTLT